MEEHMSTQEQQLCQFLADLPAQCNYRYTPEAARKLLENLFWSLAVYAPSLPRGQHARDSEAQRRSGGRRGC